MRRVLFILGLAGVTVAGCGHNSSSSDGGGGDSDILGDGGTGDAGLQGDGGDVDAAHEATDLAPFGLDTRPANLHCSAPARPTGGALVTRQQVAYFANFAQMDDFEQAPGDATHWYGVSRTGQIIRFPVATGATDSDTTSYADISGRLSPRVATEPEVGLLAMTFHPNFQTNHAVYLSYNTASTGSPTNLRSVVARYTDLGNGTLDTAVGHEQLVFPADDAGTMAAPNPLDMPETSHGGGQIAFGPDGLFYYSTGDASSGDDAYNFGQSLDTLYGKVMRVDVDNIPMGKRYGIPSDNPFAITGGLPEIYAYGFRNPWRWNFDRVTGKLWLGDVGEMAWEEIDVIDKGGNYGWKLREGAHCRPPTTGCPTAGLIDPIAEYPHTGGGASVIGGYIYRGTQIPSLVGSYVFADLPGTINRVVFDQNGTGTVEQLIPIGNTIATLAEDADGELYYAEDSTQTYVFKIVPDGTPPTDPIPHMLSATGCVETGDTTKPAEGLIPYDVASPLWSDGAAKRRWFAIPDGTNITVGSDGDWDLPIGSVAMKEFSVGGKRIETRLLYHHPDGDWAGYTYEWNDAGTDAALLDTGGKTKDLGGGVSYTFPARNDCLRCHTTAAGRTLGLETAQLNRVFDYDTGRTSNQLATLDHIGMFTAAIGDPMTLAALAKPGGTGPLADRARGYLHSNCSFCHRPGGPGRGSQDLRITTPFPMQMMCDADPIGGDLGVTGAKVLAPGHPEKSIIPLRMSATDTARMPPLATHIVDTVDVQMISDWITATTTCP